MRKSNVIITVILAAVSIFLLWLWYWLGFNQVDSPLDLVISIVWWLVIIIGIVLTVKTESTRREKVRTMYVADGSFFNTELGNRVLAPGASATAAIASVLPSLQYGFDKADAPKQPGTNQPQDFRFVVRTAKFEQGSNGGNAQGQQSQGTWQGEVVNVATGNVRRFSSKAELASIIG